MKHFALIGNPISHSKSPALFKAAYGTTKYSYTLIEKPTCKEAMEEFLNGEYTGINVTSPFKDQVMQYVTHPDRISSLLGSANIIIKEGNDILSYNSDYYGVYNTIKPYITATTNALVIGAGGAGKAAALAAQDLGCTTYLANRSRDNAYNYATRIGATYITLDEIPNVINNINIIIYSLSVKIPQLENTSLKEIIFFEANYAHANYNNYNVKHYIEGREWLYNQAIPAFKLFTKEEPECNNMKRAIGL